MTKQYKITVNGKVYDVLVEEINEIVGNNSSSNNEEKLIENNTHNTTTNEKKSSSKVSIPIDDNAISVKAPMPGTILSFNVAVDDKVEEGQVLVILEAMKMENEIVSPVSGTIKSIHIEKGSSVIEGQVIIQII